MALAAGQNVAVLLGELEDVLKLDVLPERGSAPPPPERSEVARLIHSLKLLVKKQTEENAIDRLDKAFVDYAKSTANVYATVFNAINIFATTLSFVVANNAANSTANNTTCSAAHNATSCVAYNATSSVAYNATSSADNNALILKHPEMHAVLIALTLGFLPLSLLTVGLAHAMVHMLSWKKVAVMLMAEVVYMMVMCILFGAYLMTHPNQVVASIVTVLIATATLVMIPWWLFKTPTDVAAFWMDDNH